MAEYILGVIKVKGVGGIHWAERAKRTIDGTECYRLYYYKKEATTGLKEWEPYVNDGTFGREFMHNFDSADELGISGV